ncbi:flavodoxin [Methanobrevibacter olleyae]|uniref:Flavodoxin n=1 Tax=Methanobrevibacter olleyae TaxID=294671 RepID=A0A126QZT2_METOL|nr:flavodoxin [Methanobrevibacter olleyae]AMK15348.1 flavodoxin [Methanobrevibacter olleyae]SFL69838.1 Flavodoxin [Methanobrevibacter olleyae]
MSKSLILYFSREGNNYSNEGIKCIEIGNTEVIANYIKEFTDADLFKMDPLIDYPEDYMECTKIAQEELNDDARPELKGYIGDIAEYDLIYIGFPNWWGTMPMPVWTQLEKLDFSGKTIKPFVTHEGSGFGKSLNDLEKLCTGANIKSGLSIQGSFVSSSKQKVQNWVLR